MNFIEGRFDASERRFENDALLLTLDDAHLERLKGRERVTVGVRPEHIEVSTAARDGWLEASVYVTELMGNETFVFLRLGSEKIIARAPADFRAEMESRVWIQLDSKKALFFDSATGAAIND